MKRSQSENKNKRKSPIVWLLLVLLLLSLTVGGVSAFLSMSATTSNTFTNAADPTVTVIGTQVTVNPNGYAVYLRVAVDASWKKDGMILPEEPDGAYTCNSGWKEIGGFYYYQGTITGEKTLTPVTVNAVTKEGCELVVNVAAQVIQAVGETDGKNPIPAVEDAWRVSPADFLTTDAGN